MLFIYQPRGGEYGRAEATPRCDSQLLSRGAENHTLPTLDLVWWTPNGVGSAWKGSSLGTMLLFQNVKLLLTYGRPMNEWLPDVLSLNSLASVFHPQVHSLSVQDLREKKTEGRCDSTFQILGTLCRPEAEQALLSIIPKYSGALLDDDNPFHWNCCLAKSLSSEKHFPIGMHLSLIHIWRCRRRLRCRSRWSPYH